jgi:hypothetical protein
MTNLKTMKTLCIAFILVVFNTSAEAQNDATNQLEWKLIKKSKKGDGWKLYKRKVSNSKIKEVKIVGKINSPMQIAQASSMDLFVDSSVYKTKKGKSLGWFKIFKHTKEEIELYSFMKGNIMYKDRDVVVRYNTYKDETKNAMGVKWHQIDKEGYEPTDTVIRMPVDMGDWRFEIIDSESCMATLKFQFDPGGKTPNWMINMIVKYYAPHEFKHLKELCENK